MFKDAKGNYPLNYSIKPEEDEYKNLIVSPEKIKESECNVIKEEKKGNKSRFTK